MWNSNSTQRNWKRCYGKEKVRKNYTHLIILILIIAAVCASIFAYRYYQKGYYIQNMNVQIDMNSKKQYMVTETIDVHYYAHKHGISRVIGDSISKGIYDISDVDVKGAPFEVSKENNFAIIIGDPAEEVIGDKRYVVTYTIDHYEGGFNSMKSIGMDVLGNHWDTKVKNFSARINYPDNAFMQEVHAYYDKLLNGTNYIYRKNSSSIKCDYKDNSIFISCDKTIPAAKGIKVEAVFNNDAFTDIPQMPQDTENLFYNSSSEDKEYSFLEAVISNVGGIFNKYTGFILFVVVLILSFFRRGNDDGYYNDGYYDNDSSGGFGGDSSDGGGDSSGDSGGGSSW